MMSFDPDTEIVWKPRLLKTAGTCVSKWKKVNGEKVRFFQINLSSKVLDSADRLRDTLIHEMCHAASWVISGIHNGHGVIWKDWAKQAMTRFPELPLIARCHNYQIRTKYSYICKNCGAKVKILSGAIANLNFL